MADTGKSVANNTREKSISSRTICNTGGSMTMDVSMYTLSRSRIERIASFISWGR